MPNILAYTNAAGPIFTDATTGFTTTFNVQGQSANRVFTIPNTAGSFVVAADPQFFVPIAAGTVAPVAAASDNIPCFINPAGTLATMTLTLPTGTVKGQVLTATFTQIITTLTVTATNVDNKGLVAPVAAAVGNTFAWVWDSVSTKWNRTL